MNARFLAVKGLCPQGGVEHIFGAGGVLDDTALRGQIALEDGNAAVRSLGIVKAVDNILPGHLPGEAPVTVITSRWSMDLISSITRGTPPA